MRRALAPQEPAQSALAFGGSPTCPVCGRELPRVVIAGRLDLSALAALGLEGFNAALRCWNGRCRGGSSHA